ncbi:unnamed protein product [Gemmata massiliana]|uniref:Uncharacterized protein n=1 Tax=Gemmata massiliana TaxID=1210884 RepID=A0A6P2DCZ0_9BACT|nr:hypothetical protein [Gemmata massiliana]VTR99178.1 unnamed protein product [Gemmata massiliana]
MITIQVSGPRGEGNTISAMRIVSWFRSFGFEVEYRGHTELQTACIEDLLRNDHTVFDRATEPRQFLVLDVGAEELADEDD